MAGLFLFPRIAAHLRWAAIRDAAWMPPPAAPKPSSSRLPKADERNWKPEL